MCPLLWQSPVLPGNHLPNCLLGEQDLAPPRRGFHANNQDFTERALMHHISTLTSKALVSAWVPSTKCMRNLMGTKHKHWVSQVWTNWLNLFVLSEQSIVAACSKALIKWLSVMLLNSDSAEHTASRQPMINETTNHGTILLKEMTLTKGNKLPITAASPQELRWWPYPQQVQAGYIDHNNVLTNSSWQVHAK